MSGTEGSTSPIPRVHNQGVAELADYQGVAGLADLQTDSLRLGRAGVGNNNPSLRGTEGRGDSSAGNCKYQPEGHNCCCPAAFLAGWY